MIEQANISLAFERTAGETSVRRLLEQALEDRFDLTPHPADAQVFRANSPAGLLALQRPMMAISWQIPDALYENERAEKLMSGLLLLTTGIVSTIKASNETRFFDLGFSFHPDPPSTRYHLTLEGSALHWVSGTQGNWELQRQSRKRAGPSVDHLQHFNAGEIIRFNGGLDDVDLWHSAPNLRPGERRRFALAAPAG